MLARNDSIAAGGNDARSTQRPPGPRRAPRIAVLLSVLLLVLLVPSASAKVERTDYSAFQFPMVWPGSE